MSDTNDTRLLLELVKRIESNQGESVGNLKDGLEKLSKKIDSNENKMDKRDEALILKVDGLNNITGRLKTDHMDIKAKVNELEKSVGNLLKLRHYMMGVIGTCTIMLGAFASEIIDIIKKIVFSVSGTFESKK